MNSINFYYNSIKELNNLKEKYQKSVNDLDGKVLKILKKNHVEPHEINSILYIIKNT